MSKSLTLIIGFLCFTTLSLLGQDSYHQSIIDQLKDDYGVEGSTFVFQDNELDNIADFQIYGSVNASSSDIADFSFSRKTEINVTSAGANVWDAGLGLVNKKNVSENDIVLFTFWARKTSDDSNYWLFIEDAVTYDKEIYSEIDFTQDWSQYFIAFKASKTYSINKLKIGFHLAGAQQDFEIAGFTALNYGQDYNLSDLPSLYNPANYGGYEDDAPWRAEAEERITQHRKAKLTVKVVDNMGTSVPSAEVSIDMTKHEFGFGTAVVTCRFSGNDCQNSTYVSKLFDLDGEGHGFNIAVTENALKWNGWEEEWIGSPAETKSAVSYLHDNGVEIRGHTLIWPGWGNLPSDMQQNKDDLDYLKTRISERINEMLTDDVLGDIVTEWDVLNEITTNRDLESALEGQPGYTTGREIYQEIFDQITSLRPNNVNYINDYVTLSNGGFGEMTVGNYKQFLTEIKDSGAQLDGIGFQAHIGPTPTSILKVKETLDEFDALYDVEMKITEFDLDDKVDEDVQAKYLRDFLTMIFSHKKMNAFLMWGFWDGNHWKGNAPMFDLGWNLKPSGQAFNDLVFNEWWTDEQGSTNSQGEFVSSIYKGEHRIVVNYDGKEFVVEGSYSEDEVVEINIGTLSQANFEVHELQVVPNPSFENFQVNLPSDIDSAMLIVRDLQGRKILEREHYSGEILTHNFAQGVYSVELVSSNKKFLGRIVVSK